MSTTHLKEALAAVDVMQSISGRCVRLTAADDGDDGHSASTKIFQKCALLHVLAERRTQLRWTIDLVAEPEKFIAGLCPRNEVCVADSFCNSASKGKG